MGYLRCETCGAKALSAASTCPKCSAAFELHDGRGQRVPLRKCSGCGIMHRKDRSCHWCGELKAPAWRSPAAIRSTTGVAALALLAISSWAMREPAADMLSQIFEPAPPKAEAPRTALQTSAAEVAPVVAQTGLDSSSASAPLQVADTALTVASVEPARSDTTTWEPAVARTWVNVRSDAGRGGDVVGVIKPSERAMLGGESRAGWRQVKAPDMSGWVDPRLFESDSLRTRG